MLPGRSTGSCLVEDQSAQLPCPLGGQPVDFEIAAAAPGGEQFQRGQREAPIERRTRRFDVLDAIERHGGHAAPEHAAAVNEVFVAHRVAHARHRYERPGEHGCRSQARAARQQQCPDGIEVEQDYGARRAREQKDDREQPADEQAQAVAGVERLPVEPRGLR